MVDASRIESSQALADRLGVVDALLFRRLSASAWVHLGGLGRGRGWAGVVDVSATDDQLLEHVPDHPGGVHRFTHGQVARVLGPYYGVGGALVRVSSDVVVLLGNPTSALSPNASDDDLRRLADSLERSVEDVAPSKRLADELEVLHAVRSVTMGTATDLAGTLRRIVEVAMEALSCEVGLLRDASGRIAAVSSWVGVDVADPQLGAALDFLERRAGGDTFCIQDTATESVLAPLGREQGVRSLLAVGIPAPVGGVLVVAHTSAGPRGFTALCQQLGRSVVGAAAVIAHTAALREDLHAAVELQTRTARRDPLTGLDNRLAWDEALVSAQARTDAGGCVTVLTLDIDGLKQVNDTAGHEEGDELLRRCADVLTTCTELGDVCVRLGGDEFALLMPHAGADASQRFADLVHRLSGDASSQQSVAASVGMAVARAGGRVADAVREADIHMYAAKRRRRTELVARLAVLEEQRSA